MRTMMTAVAALALSGLFAGTSARAEEMHTGGGPVQAGNQCWVATHPDKDLGYWKDCPASASAPARTQASTTTKAHASKTMKTHASKTMKTHASKTTTKTNTKS
jgi:hypothetical protein